MAKSCSSITSGSDIALDTGREDDDAIDVNPVEQVVADGGMPSSSIVENSSTKCSSLQKTKVREGANEAVPKKDVVDEVDGDTTKGAGNFVHIEDPSRKEGKNQFDYKAPSIAIPLNLPTDFIISSANNENKFQSLKRLCHPLSVTITTENSKGSGTLIHPHIWKAFKALQSLHRNRLQPKAESASLMIKTSKKLIANDADVATAVVEITVCHGDIGRQEVLRFYRCSKECYDIEDCNLLVCHSVPIKVCEYLEKTYETFCVLAESISRDVTLSKKFLLIGHCNGGEIVISEGDLRVFRNTQGYEYLSLEESVDHFFARTMTNMTPEEWSKVKEITCPGDRSISIIRFAVGRFY